MSGNKKEQLVMMMNLCSSIVEGMEFLVNHQGNSRLRQDTAAGLETLNTSLEDFRARDEVIKSTQWLRSLVLTGLYEYEKEFLDKLYRWYCQVLQELKNLLVDEILRCPVCDGTGMPYYSALLFRQEDTEEGNPMPVRIWMQCVNCGNYYLARDNVLLETEEDEEDTRRQNASVKIARILPEMEEYIEAGAVLFVGDKKSGLLWALKKYNYQLDSCTFEGLGALALPKNSRRQFQIIVIEHIAYADNIKAVLSKVQEYLADGGVIWFDMKDMEASAEALICSGRQMWKEPAAEICIQKQGVADLAHECGLKIIDCKQTGRGGKYLEYIVGKELVSC